MKKLLLILSMIGLISTPALADETVASSAPQHGIQKESKPVGDAISIGFPINTSGVQITGRPDAINFVSIKDDSTIVINWDNVCKITKQHSFNVADLQKLNGEFLVYIIPYIISEANNGQHKC